VTTGLNPLDIFFLILIFILAVRCASRGLIAEVLAMAAIIIGIICGFLFSGILSSVITLYFGFSPWNLIIAFLLIFLLTYLIINMIREGLYNFLEGIRLEKVDNLLGFFLGILEGVLIVAIIVVLLRSLPFGNIQKLLKKSIVSGIIMSIIPAIPFLPAGTKIINNAGKILDV